MREEKGPNEREYDLKCKINELNEQVKSFNALVLENEEMKREITFLHERADYWCGVATDLRIRINTLLARTYEHEDELKRLNLFSVITSLLEVGNGKK